MTVDTSTDTKIQALETEGGAKFYKIGWDDLDGPARNFAVKVKESRPTTDCGIVGAPLLITDSGLTNPTPRGLVLSADLLIEAILAKNGNAFCFSLADIQVYIEAFGKDRVKPWVQEKGASIRDFAVMGDGRRNADQGRKYCGQISILFAAIARSVEEGNTGLMQYLFNELQANPNQRLWAYAQNKSGQQGQFDPCYNPEVPFYSVDGPLLYCMYLAAAGACQKRVVSPIRTLINNQADANLPNIRGRTPYMEALRAGYRFAVDEFSGQAPDLAAIAAPNYQVWARAAAKAGKKPDPATRPKKQSFMEYVCEAAPPTAVQYLYDKGWVQDPRQKQMAADVTKKRLTRSFGKAPATILADARLAYFCACEQFPPGPERASALARIGSIAAGIRGAMDIKRVNAR